MRTLDERKTREKALQDERFKVDEGSRGNVERFYGITEASHGYFRRRLNELARYNSVLEFGCGNGAHALELCGTAAHVTGIDISDVAVEIGTANARAANLPKVDFYAMDAEKLEFANDTFDRICGIGILHISICDARTANSRARSNAAAARCSSNRSATIRSSICTGA